MTDGFLWTLVIVALVALVVVQVVSARAARKIGGKSSRAVVTLRLVNAAAVLALVVWLVYQATWG